MKRLVANDSLEINIDRSVLLLSNLITSSFDFQSFHVSPAISNIKHYKRTCGRHCSINYQTRFGSEINNPLACNTFCTIIPIAYRHHLYRTMSDYVGTFIDVYDSGR